VHALVPHRAMDLLEERRCSLDLEGRPLVMSLDGVLNDLGQAVAPSLSERRALPPDLLYPSRD